MSDHWEQVGGAVTYVKPSEMKIGDFVDGMFVETSVDPKYKTLRHTLKQEDGTLKIINGTGQLNHILKSIVLGTKIRIVYDGKKKLASGAFKGTDANQWKVFKSKNAQDEKIAEAVSSLSGESLAEKIREKRLEVLQKNGPPSDFHQPDGEKVPF